MPHPAIKVEGLWKEYTIGGPQQGQQSFREMVVGALAAPFRKLARFQGNAAPQERFWALRDINFEIQPGEVVGIIGRNGAGKSTLLKILSRITEPSKGQVNIRGRVSSLLEVGTGFHPELTGRENVFLNGAILGMSRREIQGKFDEIVAFAEIEKFLDTPVKHYSSGMYVRLAFAVAAHLEPDILVVDEVLAVGDAQFQKKCLGKMGDVAKIGRAVLFVSHNLDAISSLCASGMLLKSGALVQRGPIGKVLTAYVGEAALAADGKIDFSEHPLRSPHHQCWIKEVSLSVGGRTTSTAVALLPMIIEMKVVARRRLRSPKFAIAIEDHIGRRVFAVGNFMSPNWDAILERDSIIRCAIPRLRLGAGRYLLSVSLSSNADGLLDSVDGGMAFNVESFNCYGNGEPYSPAYGPVLEESSWEMQ